MILLSRYFAYFLGLAFVFSPCISLSSDEIWTDHKILKVWRQSAGSIATFEGLMPEGDFVLELLEGRNFSISDMRAPEYEIKGLISIYRWYLTGCFSFSGEENTTCLRFAFLDRPENQRLIRSVSEGRARLNVQFWNILEHDEKTRSIRFRAQSPESIAAYESSSDVDWEKAAEIINKVDSTPIIRNEDD